MQLGKNYTDGTAKWKVVHANLGIGVGYDDRYSQLNHTHDAATTTTAGFMSSTDKTKLDGLSSYSNFVQSGSSAAAGLVPAPPSTAGTSKFLREDGTWQEPAGSTDVNVTNTLNNTAQAYVTGTTSSTTNTGTQVFDSGVYLTTTAGRLHVGSLELESGIVFV